VYRRVTMRYALAVGMIAVLALGSGMLLGGLATRHASDSEVTATASKQRKLALDIALAARDAAEEQGTERTKQLVLLGEAADTLEAQHAGLRVVAASDSVGNADLRLVYQYLDSGVADLVGGARQFARDASLAPPASEATNRAAREVERLASGSFQSRLERAVRLHIAAGAAAGQSIIDLNALLTLAILALLGVTVQLIFRPLARELSTVTSRLTDEASTDPLTGLLNRRAFRAALEMRAVESGTVGLMMIDLDWFKLVNDSDGHAAGDRLLCELTRRLQQFAGDDLLFGRWGGDEFVVALFGRDQGRTLAHAAAIHAGLMPASEASRSSTELPISATVGVAWSSDGLAGLEAVLAAADDAARRGKEIARGTLYPALPEDFERLDREILIKQAFERHKGCPPDARAWLQPIVRLSDGQVLGMELLARWEHPQLGRIAPTEFLDIATRSGWMLALGSHLRASGFAAVAQLRGRGHRIGRVAINLGQPELARDSILTTIEAELAACGLPLSILEIEITEDLLLDRVPEVVRERLTALRRRGARLALDDFGTGYAGMSQLL
ncbi:MAG: EAL domain-containing protein, partial [Polymorphobacter sp.]